MTEQFDPKTLSEKDLCACLNEMRNRGWAVAAYGVSDLCEGPFLDGDYSEVAIEKWLKDNRDTLDDVMCEAVYQFAQGEDLSAYENEDIN